MRNILLLSYHFPPEISGGVGRPFSLYRYLPRCGYQPIILTNSCYGLLPNEDNIYRFDALANWPKSGSIAKKFMLKCAASVAKRLGFIELNDFYWQNKVNKKVDRIIRENQIEVVYSTYPSIDSLHLALAIKQKHALPLITEFRDGLAYEPVILLKRWNKSRLKKLESGIINAASTIITIGENLSNYFSIHYPEVPTYTVYNGFDPADFEHINSIKYSHGPKITIFNFGSFSVSKSRDVAPLFKALQRLQNGKSRMNLPLELCLVGRYTRKEKYLINRYNLNDIVKIYPTMNRREGFSWICKEGSYLLFYGIEGEKTIISTKLLEYLNLGKPIIGICKGNEAEEIIRKTKTGEVCDFHQDSIYDLLKKCLTNEITFAPDRAEIDTFNRIHQAKMISEIITGVIANTGER